MNFKVDDKLENVTIKKKGRSPIMPLVFTILTVAALLFVYWIGFASFENNCYDIYRQSYSTIIGQSVYDIESAVRNGKTLENFYGIDRLLLSTAGYIRDDAQVAVTYPSGVVLYATFDDEAPYTELLRSEQVRINMSFEAPDRESSVAVAGDYEFLIQPIYAPDGSHSGNLCLIYPARDSAQFAQQSSLLRNMTLLVALVTAVAVLICLFITGRPGSTMNKRLADAMPLLILAAGILVQSVFSFFTYQTQYRNIMLDSARTTCVYIESLVSQAHDRGVPYDRMYGLDEFFADKLQQMPGIWDIKLVHVLANSQDILTRENDLVLSIPISGGDGLMRMRLDATISQQFIDEKMSETMLLSLITLLISIVAVVEMTRLPELISLKLSRHFETRKPEQQAGIQNALRLSSFLMYTGVYIVLPFSSMLVRQWRQTLFGFSLDVTAGIPMTVEMLALMVGGLVCAALFRRLNVKVGVGVSVAFFTVSNIACLFVMDPLSLAALRFLSGFSFSAILYAANYIVSYGTDGNVERSAALAGINSGLLGGIMAGGALGAIIANTMGIAMCFIVAAGLCVATGIVMFLLVPWSMLKAEQGRLKAAHGGNADSPAASAAPGGAPAEKRISAAGAMLHPRMLFYFLLVIVPFSFGLMFIVAGMPSFADARGLSPLLLSCGFLANGIAGIYLGKPLLESLTRRCKSSTLLALVLVTGGIAIGVIFLPPAWFTLLLCAFLLGIFDGVGTPTFMMSFMELPGMVKVPPVDAIAVGNTLMRIVNAASPLLYGVIIAAASGSFVIFAVLGGAFVAAGAIYMVLGNTKMMRPVEVNTV